VHFLRPVGPGRILGQGRILRREADVAVIEAMLFDSERCGCLDGDRDGAGDPARLGARRGVS
jgi:acyl-coenzyme A thioesterase PaaI-like protein